MIVLGIETATVEAGCAIGGVEGVLASFRTARGRRHAEVLAPAIDFVRRQAGIELAEVSVIAVDIGPGLFTGLRVGVATAKAMAHALRVPMIGLPSLDLLAFQVRHSARLIVPVIDAKRGEVFTAYYRQVPGGVQRLDDFRLVTPEDLASDLHARREEALLVGDGAIRHDDVFGAVEHAEIGSRATASPTADALVELAHPRAIREEFVPPSELAPLYLRRSDAEINWERRAAADAAESSI